MRKLFFVAGLMFALAAPAAAQDVEVFMGYSFAKIETLGPDRENLHGWNAAVEAKVAPFLGLVADFSGHYGDITIIPPGVDSSINTHHVLFGPRVNLPGPVRPFVHALFGAARGNAGVFGGTDSEWAFGMAVGGGVDANFTDRVAWRIIQGDYLMNRFFARTNNNFRLSSGLVFRF